MFLSLIEQFKFNSVIYCANFFIFFFRSLYGIGETRPGEGLALPGEI